MRQLDGVTGQRLENEVRDAQAASRETQPRMDVLRAANEHLRETDTRLQPTIANERPNGEVLNQTAQQTLEFNGRFGQVVRSHYTLAAQLNQAMQALEGAEQNCAAAATTAAQYLAQREAELAAAKAEAATLRESLARHLANANDRAADAEAAAERLMQRATEVVKVVEAHQNLERRFHAALVLLQEQDADRAATTERLARREAELAEATETRGSLEKQLAEAESALGEAVRRSSDDRSTAIQQAAQKQSEFDAVLREEVAKYDTLARDLLATREELAHADTRLKEAEARQALAMSSAAAQHDEKHNEQEARHKGRMAEAAAARDALSRQLAEAERALGEAVRRSADDRSTAMEQAAQRQSEFEALRREEVAKYDSLTQDLLAARQELAQADTMRQEADAQHALAMTTAAAQRNEQEARHEARMAAAAERLAQQEATLREGTAARQMLEGQLAGAHTALQAAEQRAEAERLAATQRAAERDREFVARLDQEAAARETLEQALTVARSKVAVTETAIRDAEHRHASHMTTVTARFADQQIQYETGLAEAAAARDLVDQRLREVEVSFERSRQERAADAAAAAERLARLEAQRVEAVANLQMFEGQLADANAALRVAEQRVATERLTAEQQATHRQAEFEAKIARETAGRHDVEQNLATSQQKLAESESALRYAEQRHAAAMTSAAAQFAERQREFETLSAQISAVKDASDLRLREAEATFERIHDERTAEAIAVAEQLTQLESELATAIANGETLERRLAEVTNALHTAEELVVSERVASAERAIERQMEFDARLSLELETRNTIEQALAATRQDLLQTEAALRDATAQYTNEMTSASNELSAQHSQYTTRLAQASAAHAALEQKLADAVQRHASALNAAATERTEQQSKYETRLAEITTARKIVSQQLHDTETTLLRTQQESDANAIASAERLSKQESELAAASAARQVLEGRLVDTETALKHAESRALAERTAAIQQSAQRRAEFDAQLAREVEARHVVERDLAENRVAADETRQALLGQSAALTAEMRELEARLTQELARERADYEGKLADANENFERIRAVRDGQIKDQATAHRQQVEQLHSSVNAVLQDFEEMRHHRDTLQVEADRVPQLTNQLEASLAEIRRQFDGSPIGILRCSEAGVLKEANRALITALGYRNLDALRALGSAASVFESPDDFRWLIEHCDRTPSESVDCIWKKKDGSRLMMRLRALRLSADVVDIVAEDLTTLRAVEERLRQAQRMEAVGRLASEVADTCDILLRNVSRDGQRWLATVGSNAAQRHQGELILGEVKRAASFLRQLSVYGEKQTSALAAVDVNTVLRDLAPVLKRVAGDDIELVLPKKVFALNVDVDAERVERVLVNIAAYGRARMPSGGRLIIELARVVVDLDFVTKYPNVRQGAHALISVTEVRTAASVEWPIGIRGPVEATAIATTPERPGVDLGALQALIGDCGGHLWMKAEPGGDMELKIHLPLRSADTSRSAGVVGSALGRSVSAWFQS